MKTTQAYRHCTPHNGKFTWQLSILGSPCRTSAHFITAEEAALDCDLVKHFLRTEFRLDLPASLDGEQFSSLAYSRRHVDLSDSLSVAMSIPGDVRDFINEHAPALIAHKNSAPPESTASKFRRSDMIKLPAVRTWVEALELAEMDEAAFAAIDYNSFFLRLSVVEKSLVTALKSLGLALRMHPSLTNPKLADRASKISELIIHFQQNLEYVSALARGFKAEQASVETAVATLEANRPNLS